MTYHLVDWDLVTPTMHLCLPPSRFMIGFVLLSGVFCRPFLVSLYICSLVIVLPVFLRTMASEYPFDIFKLFEDIYVFKVNDKYLKNKASYVYNTYTRIGWWVSTNMFSLLQRLMSRAYSFPKSTERDFHVEGTWHWPNTAPSVAVHGESFCIIIRQHRREGILYPPPGELLLNSMNSMNQHQYYFDKWLAINKRNSTSLIHIFIIYLNWFDKLTQLYYSVECLERISSNQL